MTFSRTTPWGRDYTAHSHRIPGNAGATYGLFGILAGSKRLYVTLGLLSDQSAVNVTLPAPIVRVRLCHTVTAFSGGGAITPVADESGTPGFVVRCAATADDVAGALTTTFASSDILMSTAAHHAASSVGWRAPVMAPLNYGGDEFTVPPGELLLVQHELLAGAVTRSYQVHARIRELA